MASRGLFGRPDVVGRKHSELLLQQDLVGEL